jgi:hypothetical protein
MLWQDLKNERKLLIKFWKRDTICTWMEEEKDVNSKIYCMAKMQKLWEQSFKTTAI